MLSSTAIRLSVTTATWSSQNSGLAQLGRASSTGSVTTQTVGGGTSRSGVGDLNAQLEAQLQKDVRYQILRKFFALDRQDSGSASRLSLSGWQGRSLQASLSVGSASSRSIETSASAVKLDLSYVRAQALQLQGAIAAAADSTRFSAHSASLQTRKKHSI